MPLSAGQSLSFYEILAPLGAGAMGEVYSARDTRLEREVAIKVLPEHFIEDEERLRRFEREARSLAALNHPNVAQIHGVDQVDDTCFLVLELVPGETLEERLSRGPLPIEEAIDVCRQIAEGLEAAHEAGVIHRDLKPANVRITPDGKVKVLDFGLAKPTGPDAATESTADSVLSTEEGRLLGTPTYMAPEQARGKAIDRRIDVWAFGCVLFECLTGRRAFDGETIADVIARVLEEPPAWHTLPRGVPPEVRNLLERALDKGPRSRLRDIGEARVRLERATDSPVVEPPEGLPKGVPFRVAAGSALLLALVAAFVGWSLRSGEPTVATPLRKLELEWTMQPLQEAVLSPDGRRIAVVAGGRLFVHDLTELEPREIPDTEGARFVFWAPDGSELAYLQGRRLWRSGADGRGRKRIADLDWGWVSGAGAHWTEDDRIVFSRGSTHLFEVKASGGKPRLVLESKDVETEHYHAPCVLPGSRGIVFATHGTAGTDTLELLVDGERTILLQVPGETVDDPCYSPTGHILFSRGPDPSGIWALPFSIRDLRVNGEPFVVSPKGKHPSLAKDGSLLYRGGRSSLMRGLVWVDLEGNVAGEIGEPLRDPRAPRLSPDGRWIVVSAYEGDSRGLWLVDVENGSRRPLTLGGESDSDPSWQGSRRVLFTRHGESDLQACAVEIDSLEVEVLSGRRGGEATDDGRYRVFHQRGEIWLDDGEGEPEIFHTSSTSHQWPVLSPGGDFVVFGSATTARGAITLKRFPAGSGEWQIHSEGGTWPRWSPAGDELYFTSDGALHVMAIETGEEVSFGAPRRLFGELDRGLICGLGYDLDLSGERILCLRSDKVELPTATLVQSWYSEFETRRGERAE